MTRWTTDPQARPILPAKSDQQIALLIIEDDAVVRDLIANNLSCLDVAVHLATSAREGILLAKIHRPRIVTVDLRLPDADGFDFVRDLVDSCIGAAIIVVSAYVDVPTTVQLMRLGVTDVLRKPWRSGGLLAVVELALSRRAEMTANGVAARLAALIKKACDSGLDVRTLTMWAHASGGSPK